MAKKANLIVRILARQSAEKECPSPCQKKSGIRLFAWVPLPPELLRFSRKPAVTSQWISCQAPPEDVEKLHKVFVPVAGHA